MNPLVLLISVLLSLPYNAYAHMGLMGSSNLIDPMHFELFEASLVAAVLVFYVVSGHISSMKNIISRYRQQKKNQHKHKE